MLWRTYITHFRDIFIKITKASPNICNIFLKIFQENFQKTLAFRFQLCYNRERECRKAAFFMVFVLNFT